MALEVVRKHAHPLNGGNSLPLSEPKCFSEASKAIPVAQRLSAIYIGALYYGVAKFK